MGAVLKRSEAGGELFFGGGRWTLFAAVLLLAAVVFVSTCAFGGERFAFEKAEMGLPVRVTLYASGPGEAQSAAEAAFQRIEALNAIFSDYDSDSELSRLSDSSGQGRPVKVSEELWEVIAFSQRVAVRSGGAFDMSVGPLVNLWRAARRKKELPAKARLEEALARSGYGAVRLDARSRTVELTRQRMRMDAGGVAKGYAMEQALKVLSCAVVVARCSFPQCIFVTSCAGNAGQRRQRPPRRRRRGRPQPRPMPHGFTVQRQRAW